MGERWWLRPHSATRQEVADLLAIVDRDPRDAEGNISADWRFGIPYNGALKLCAILLHASGHRPRRICNTIARSRRYRLFWVSTPSGESEGERLQSDSLPGRLPPDRGAALTGIMQAPTCPPRICSILVVIFILILTSCYYDDTLDDVSNSQITCHIICNEARLHYRITQRIFITIHNNS
jgi:hypothetical protein